MAASADCCEEMMNKVYCDRHPRFFASIITDCGGHVHHRLCYQCIYAIVEAVDGKSENDDCEEQSLQILCPICQQQIRNECWGKEEMIRMYLSLSPELRKIDDQKREYLPTELHFELMHFLGMEMLQKVVPASSLLQALFGEKMRKWNARNEWMHDVDADKAWGRKVFEISQHGLSVCKANYAYNRLANVQAKNPFELNTSATIATTTITVPRRFHYFEIRVNKTTGPILFGVVKGKAFNMHDWFEGSWAQQEMVAQLQKQQQQSFGDSGGMLLESRRPFFLANDITAWPRTHWNTLLEWRCLQFFAQQNPVPTAAAVGSGKFADGDVFGCGLLHFPQLLRHQQLFFTRNGQLFGEPIWLSPANEEDELLLFPFVGLVNEGTSVTGNFGESDKFPYAYNIGQHNGPIGTVSNC